MFSRILSTYLGLGIIPGFRHSFFFGEIYAKIEHIELTHIQLLTFILYYLLTGDIVFVIEKGYIYRLDNRRRNKSCVDSGYKS